MYEGFWALKVCLLSRFLLFEEVRKVHEDPYQPFLQLCLRDDHELGECGMNQLPAFLPCG